ncbi:hypothetical protein [Streptomyces sp. PvR034]|uniref:hypothetical protein n=1 Tax=Streptomyces sp. PvR034 TaxID=3156401 RepID=UPI0033991DAE
MTPENSIPVPPPLETRFHVLLCGVVRWSSALTTLLVVGVVAGHVDEAAVLAATPLVLSDRTALLFRVLLRR